MYTVALFLGYPVDADLAQTLDGAGKKTAELYIQKEENGHYLGEVMHEGQRYLGKFLIGANTLADLVLLEANIYSLLKKIAPHYNYATSSLVLFPISHPA